MCLLAVETPSKPLTSYNRRYWRSYCLAICRAPLPFGAEIRWTKTVTQWCLLQKKYSHYHFTSRILGSIKSEFKDTAQNHESIIKWDGKCDEFQGEIWGSQITQKLVAGSIPQQFSSVAGAVWTSYRTLGGATSIRNCGDLGKMMRFL